LYVLFVEIIIIIRNNKKGHFIEIAPFIVSFVIHAFIPRPLLPQKNPKHQQVALDNSLQLIADLVCQYSFFNVRKWTFALVLGPI